MENVSIVVHKRDATGTRAAKQLRKSGLIPGMLYGHGKPATHIAVEPNVLRDALGTSAGMHAVLDVKLEGQKRGHKAIIKELALDKVKHTVIHVDLEEVRLDETIETRVAVHFEGESKGVKAGGVLDESIREVTVKGVVTRIPEHLVLDITELDVNGTLKVADLQVPDGLEILDDPEEVLCSVLPPRKAAEEAVEGEEGVEPVPEAAPAEPELVGRKETGEEA
ncbi:MAG: General stress protein CTC [Actinobacteria bacterium ADurb.BinA094]|nr:MAG: General stress protein CTC [Actinobacteria bacterium ADurb.BinA094]